MMPPFYILVAGDFQIHIILTCHKKSQATLKGNSAFYLRHVAFNLILPKDGLCFVFIYRTDFCPSRCNKSLSIQVFSKSILEDISKNGFWFNPPEANKYRGGREVQTGGPPEADRKS